mmetsp:Transcript_3343/g.10574  ORF Transcript_3343/g.10574 Transcript_3343/m.10574 type:complete len:382 (+) Transcript_3343:276-1421(+)
MASQHSTARLVAARVHVHGELDQPVGVAPLVVVPRDELDEGRGELDASPGVEDGRAGLADEVGGDNLVLGVADDALGVGLRRELDLGLDLVVRAGGLELAGEVDDRDVDGGHAEGHARELALHDRVALGDCLGGAGGGGDDVGRGGAARAPVGALHRRVDDDLRGGGGVHGGHQALLDAELVVDGLDQRGEAVGGARRARHHVHGLRVIGVGVDADDNGRGLGVLGRRGDNDLLGAARDVLQAVRGAEESAGGLADVLDANLAPWDLSRVTGGRERDGEAVDHEAVLVDLAGAREAAVHGVVLEEVLHVLRRHRRVDVLQHKRVAVHGDADHLAADAAKAVHAELDRGVRVAGHHQTVGQRQSRGGESEHYGAIRSLVRML